MYAMKIEHLDWILNELLRQYPLGDSISRFYIDLKITQKEVLEIEEYLENNDFIELHGDYRKKISYWGKGILEEYGSLEAYLKHVENENAQEMVHQSISRTKELFELKHLKWLNKTRWLPLIFASISLIISVIAILKTFNLI